MIDLNDKRCTACGSCVQKCPQRCLSLAEDGNGFLFPSVSIDKCTNCDLCVKVCPIGTSKNADYIQKSYACINVDGEVLLNATSGGVFGAIAEYVLNQGGVAYGCAYSGHLKAEHIRVEDGKSLSRLFGSKYVQSHTKDTFSQCESDLKEGRLVLYSGTPCQIAGLKKFLIKDYSNLITVDLVCHGVASQAYFDKFIDYLEQKENAVCIDYNFRSKKNAGWSVAGVAGFKDKNGKYFEKKQYYFSNYYYFYYLNCAVYRDSCYSCEYANLSREGDFTLGDLWGAEGLSLDFSTDNGCSLVLVNTKKAQGIFERLKLQSKEISIEAATKNNSQLKFPSKSRFDREKLFREFRQESAGVIQKRFVNDNLKAIFIGRLKYFIPLKLKKVLLKLRYRK